LKLNRILKEWKKLPARFAKNVEEDWPSAAEPVTKPDQDAEMSIARENPKFAVWSAE
jgi:hypothetical protein